ncbi:ATP/GTP-binding protein OS=Streptomyces fumanus OX=67302 GN=GCM10018772_70400 PE=4 SV=1 [Streptomyces fumanus]
MKPKSKKRGGSASGTGPADRRKASRKERARRTSERARAKAEDTAGSAGSGWKFYTPPPRGERRSAYDSMRDTDPQQQEVWVTEQVFPPGYQASPREPLTTGTRGLPAGNGSPTTNMKEAPVGNAPAVQTGAVTTAMDDGMDPEHATEVTLDDVVDFLDEVVSEAFAAHDECLQLSGKAKELMYTLDEVSVRLAAKHNVRGRVTAWAMRKLADSMEVLSRKAEGMSVKSLHAAETCEIAKTEMDDAYRPLTQATADAGLRTPSARVHNEN